MQSDPMKSLLLHARAILKTFPPDEYEKIRFGGNYWVILSSMLELESDKKKFGLEDVLQQIEKGKHTNDEPLNANNVLQVLRKLDGEKRLLTQTTKDLYTFASGVPELFASF